MPRPIISLNLLCSGRLLSVLFTAAYISLMHPNSAVAQEQPVTFNISLTYNTHFENIIPSPLSVEPNSVCLLQNSSTQVVYNPAQDQINYHSSATINTFFSYAKYGVAVECSFNLFGATSGVYIQGLIFSPSSGQILTTFIPQGSNPAPPSPMTEIAYLVDVDMSNPFHAVYHFRGNDALFALAQKTYGINLTGVELTFDVQAPSS